MANFGGLYVAVPPFYTARGDLAPEAFQAHLRRLLAVPGIEGVAVLAGPGDAALLAREEAERLLEAALEAAEDGRVLSGTPGGSTREALTFARRASDLGVSALLVAPPPGLRPTGAGMRLHLETLAHVDAPLLLVDDPRGALASFTEAELAALLDLDGVIGYAGMTPAPARLPERLPVGFTRLAPDARAADPDVDGLLSELANVAPRAVARLWSARRRGGSPPREEASAMRRAAEALQVGAPGAALRHLVGLATGTDPGHRFPLLPLSAAEEERAEDLAGALLALAAHRKDV